MNATQPSVAFTTITGKTSLLVPSPFRSAPGALPSGRSASTPAYHVVAVVSRPIRPAPESGRPAIDTVPSPVGATGVSRTTPSPEKSRTSSILGAPVRSEEHTSELQSRRDLVCRLLLEKKNGGKPAA